MSNQPTNIRDQLKRKYDEFSRTIPEANAAKKNALGFNPQGAPGGLVSVAVRKDASTHLAALDDKLEWNEKIEPEDFFRRGGNEPSVMFTRPNGDVSPFNQLDEIFRFFHQKGHEGFIRTLDEGERKQDQKGEQFDLSLLNVPMPFMKKDQEYDSILGKLRSNLQGQLVEAKKPWQERADKRAPVWERIFSPDIWADKLGQMVNLFYAVETDKAKLPMALEVLADRAESFSSKGKTVWDVLKTYRTVTVEDLMTRVRVEGQRLVPDQNGRAPLEYENTWKHIDEIIARMPADQQFTRQQLVEQELGRHYYDPAFAEQVEQPGGTLIRKSFEMGHIEGFFKLANRSGKLLDRVEVRDIIGTTTKTEPEPLIEVVVKNEQLETLFKPDNWRLNPRAPFELFKALPDKIRKDAKFDPEKTQDAHVVNFAAALQASRSDKESPGWVGGRK